MRIQIFRIAMASGVGIALLATAQTPGGGPATDPSPPVPGTVDPYRTPSASQTVESNRHLSSTNLKSPEAMRGSKILGASVTGPAGSALGSISDTIVNTATGQIEFAVIWLIGGTANGTTSGTASNAGGSIPAPTTGKKVAVPWVMLSLTPAPPGANPQPSFVFTGDNNKLESAPTFDVDTDVSQPNWRQNAFSYFGLTYKGSGFGGAESPGGANSSGDTTPNGSTERK